MQSGNYRVWLSIFVLFKYAQKWWEVINNAILMCQLRFLTNLIYPFLNKSNLLANLQFKFKDLFMFIFEISFILLKVIILYLFALDVLFPRLFIWNVFGEPFWYNLFQGVMRVKLAREWITERIFPTSKFLRQKAVFSQIIKEKRLLFFVCL